MTEQELLERLGHLDGPVRPDAGFRDGLYQRLRAELSDANDAVAASSSPAGGVTADMVEISAVSRPLSTANRWLVAAAVFVAVILVGATTVWLAPGSDTEPPVLSSPDTPSTSTGAEDSVPDTTGSADQDGGLVFDRPLPWTLVFDGGVTHVSVLDLNQNEPRSVSVEGSRGGDQPYRLTVHDSHLVVGWDEIYAYDTTTLESSLLGEATIHVPAAAPSRVWMVEYPSGRIGPGPLEVWQVHVAGGQTTDRQVLDVDGHPAHGIPGGLALESDSGVVLWNAETQEVVGVLGDGTGFVSDVTVDGTIAWCEDTCDEMTITDLNDGTKLAVSHPTGGSFDARAARFSDDGQYLAAPTDTGVVLIDTTTGESRAAITFPAETEPPSFVAWAPNSHVVFAASYSYGESETTLGYYSVVNDSAEVSTLPHVGTLSFVVLLTNEAGQLLGIEPPVDLEVGPSADCPVTIPETLFTPPAPYPPDPVYDGWIWYGTDDLWTSLKVDGLIGYRKSVWWSANFPGGSEEPEPEISVTWEKLDDPEREAIVDGAPGTNAYTPEDGDFMIAGIDPEVAGCWKVTATYKGATFSYIYETR